MYGPRKFGKEIQNMPSVAEVVHQVELMEIDEYSKDYEAVRHAKSFVEPGQVRGNRRVGSCRISKKVNSTNKEGNQGPQSLVPSSHT